MQGKCLLSRFIHHHWFVFYSVKLCFIDQINLAELDVKYGNYFTVCAREDGTSRPDQRAGISLRIRALGKIVHLEIWDVLHYQEIHDNTHEISSIQEFDFNTITASYQINTHKLIQNHIVSMGTTIKILNSVIIFFIVSIIIIISASGRRRNVLRTNSGNICTCPINMFIKIL